MIEIRNGGLILLDGEEIGRIEFVRPCIEPDVLGFWYQEDSEAMYDFLSGCEE